MTLPRTTSPLRAWLAAGLWLALIILESSEWGSAQTTGGLLHRLLAALIGELPPYLFETLHFALRKLGHFVGYGMLAWLLLRAWRASLPHLQFGNWALLALLGTGIVATADELHQLTLVGRGGAFVDVLLDLAGATVFVLLAWMVTRRSRRLPAQA